MELTSKARHSDIQDVPCPHPSTHTLACAHASVLIAEVLSLSATQTRTPREIALFQAFLKQQHKLEVPGK